MPEWVIDEREAAARLWIGFYENWKSKVWTTEIILKIHHHGGGYSAVPTPAMQSSMDQRRRELLPDSFRFTWPNLPGPGKLTSGAHYL